MLAFLHCVMWRVCENSIVGVTPTRSCIQCPVLNAILCSTVADPEFSQTGEEGRRGANPKGGSENLLFDQFFPRKLHENEGNGTERGRPWRPF